MNTILWPLLALAAALILLWAGIRHLSRRSRARRSRLLGQSSVASLTTTTWESLYGRSSVSDLPPPREFSQDYTLADFSGSQESESSGDPKPKAPSPSDPR